MAQDKAPDKERITFLLNKLTDELEIFEYLESERAAGRTYAYACKKALRLLMSYDDHTDTKKKARPIEPINTTSEHSKSESESEMKTNNISRKKDQPILNGFNVPGSKDLL